VTDILQIFGLWRGRAVWLAAGIVVSLAALAAGVSLMVLGGVVIGAAVVAGTLAAPLALRVLGSARVLLRYAERVLTHEATFRSLADLRVWFFRNLAHGSAGGLGFRHAGDVLARLVGDIEALDGLYLRILVPLAGAMLLFPLLVVLIGMHSVWLAIAIGVLFAIGAFALPWLSARAAARAGVALANAAGGLRIATLDALTGLREVRAFGAEGRMLAAVQAREATLLTTQRELAARGSRANAGALLCGQAALLAVLIAAGSSPVASVAAAFLTVAAFEAVGGLPRAGVLAGHVVAASHRVIEAANAPVPVPDPPHPGQVPIDFTLRFDSVHFRWQPDRAPVFDGLALDVPQGTRVALLGPSGAGKSTLAALMLKVAAPQHGRVLLGGVDIAALAAADVRSRIGWLAQATHLFDDTIRANLKLARPDADDAPLWAALDAARVGEMVRALPDGLDTWVGEGGARFSGGQGRRLALARALLSPAPILILDEPCAGLDAETERAFLATLNEVADGRSVILITHRLTGVERLDRIWRLSAGKAIAAAA
jgi:ATP-binding cassette subfamily C protein CydC